MRPNSEPVGRPGDAVSNIAAEIAAGTAELWNSGFLPGVHSSSTIYVQSTMPTPDVPIMSLTESIFSFPHSTPTASDRACAERSA